MAAIFHNMPDGVALTIPRRYDQASNPGKIDLPAMRVTGENQIHVSWYNGEEIRIVRECEGGLVERQFGQHCTIITWSGQKIAQSYQPKFALP